MPHATLMAGVLAAAALTSSSAYAADYAKLSGGRFSSVLPLNDGAEPIAVAPFRLRATPVSNAEFLAFVRAHPEWRRDRVAEVFAESRYLGHWESAVALGKDALPDQPVTQVSWFAAQAFCESESARLPNWHEWEFAAAADATRADARDDPAWRERMLSWYARPSNKALSAVGGDANLYGVRDLHALVWEWVDDFGALMVSADNRTQGDPDKLQFCGAGAISMQQRENYAVLMRIAMLSSLKAVDTTANLGFRCAKSGLQENP